MDDPASGVRDTRDVVVEVHDSVAPHDRMPGLEVQPEQLLIEALRADLAFERLSHRDEALRRLRAVVVCVVEVLNDRLAGVQDRGVVDMAAPQHQVVGRGVHVLIRLVNPRGILARVTSPVRHSSIHTDRRAVRARPLAPSVVVLRLRVWSEVGIQDISQGLDAKVAAVVLVRWP